MLEYPAAHIGSAQVTAATTTVFRNRLTNILPVHTYRRGGKEPVPLRDIRSIHLYFLVLHLVSGKLQRRSERNHDLVKHPFGTDATITCQQIQIQVFDQDPFNSILRTSARTGNLLRSRSAVRRRPTSIVAHIDDRAYRTTVFAIVAMVNAIFRSSDDWRWSFRFVIHIMGAF